MLSTSRHRHRKLHQHQVFLAKLQQRQLQGLRLRQDYLAALLIRQQARLAFLAHRLPLSQREQDFLEHHRLQVLLDNSRKQTPSSVSRKGLRHSNNLKEPLDLFSVPSLPSQLAVFSGNPKRNQHQLDFLVNHSSHSSRTREYLVVLVRSQPATFSEYHNNLLLKALVLLAASQILWRPNSSNNRTLVRVNFFPFWRRRRGRLL